MGFGWGTNHLEAVGDKVGASRAPRILFDTLEIWLTPGTATPFFWMICQSWTLKQVNSSVLKPKAVGDLEIYRNCKFI